MSEYDDEIKKLHEKLAILENKKMQDRLPIKIKYSNFLDWLKKDIEKREEGKNSSYPDKFKDLLFTHGIINDDINKYLYSKKINLCSSYSMPGQYYFWGDSKDKLILESENVIKPSLQLQEEEQLQEKNQIIYQRQQYQKEKEEEDEVQQEEGEEQYQKEKEKQERQKEMLEVARTLKHDKIRYLMDDAIRTNNPGIFNSVGISIGEVREVYPGFNYNTMNLRR
jgi:hypothetical protein